MEIRKILYATDGSEESLKALDYTVYLAGILGSSVTAVYVSEIHFPLTSLFPVSESTVLEMAEKTENRFRETFTQFSKRFKEKGIPFSSNIVRDGTSEGIVDTAKKEGADLIVMGKSGRGYISSTILGSNTKNVLRMIGVPVLAVRGKEASDGPEIKKILVPVDISDAPVSALPEAIELADKLGARVMAVYVFWLDGNVYEIPPGLVDELIESSKSKLAQMVEDELSAFNKSSGQETRVEIESDVLHGVSPTYVLREYALDNSVDLIIVKTHGRKGMSRLLYGSETERIIQESPCSVLAVK